MSAPLLESRQNVLGTAVFCAALAIAAALYAQRILATWAERTESELVILCVITPSAGANADQVVADLTRRPLVTQASVVKPDQVKSWVADAAKSAGASALLPPGTSLPVAIELRSRGAVRMPAEFNEMVGAIKSNPAVERVFFDAERQLRASAFYQTARWVALVWLLVTMIGALVGAAGAARNPAGPGASPLPPISPAIDLDKSSRGRVSGAPAALLLSFVPSVAGWFLLFAILLAGPLPPPSGLTLGSHLLVLVMTVVLTEVACWLGAAVRGLLG